MCPIACFHAEQRIRHAGKCKSKGEVPFATFEGAEDDKYPSTFTLRKKGVSGADKVKLFCWLSLRCTDHKSRRMG